MKKVMRTLVLVIIGLAIISKAYVAMALNPYINIPEQQRLSREAWQHYWNSLSPRQQYLVKAVGEIETNYYETYGKHIPINKTKLNEVMRAVGARKHEANFVLHRMKVYKEFDDVMERSDKLIDRIMKDPRFWGQDVREEIPQFPWPPPETSARSDVPNNFLLRSETEQPTLADIESRIRSALDAAGYTEKSYYAVPDGFALVTRLEQIEVDGTPKAGVERWALAIGPLRDFSLVAYLRALFTANVGYFRVIVFVVTPHPFSYSNARIGRNDAIEWLRYGLNRLPPSIGEKAYTSYHYCTALIYEFEKNDVEEKARTRTPGRLTGRIHLKRSGVWGLLGK